jgi:hypothetical protein
MATTLSSNSPKALCGIFPMCLKALAQTVVAGDRYLIKLAVRADWLPHQGSSARFYLPRPFGLQP